MKQKTLRLIPAVLMAFVMLIGAMPQTASADNNIPPYFYLDGERIPSDDERIQNIVTVQPARARTPMPNVTHIGGMPGDFERDPDVTMNGSLISTQRYVVRINGVDYEAFCADPGIRGPESAGAVYEITGEASAHLRNALQNGFPVNSAWSLAEHTNDERMWWAYVTRIAVAVANHPNRTFGGGVMALEQARSLANGSITADHNAFPAIMVNGAKEALDTGRDILDANARSVAFNVTHNRKTNLYHNPFRFEWASGTPSGARLIVNGNVIATAPQNPATVFRSELASFYIEMPNTEQFIGQTARVNLVGINNQFANRIWMMQNPNSPQTWQDIVFYIPEASASAAFSFDSEPLPPPEPLSGGVTIQKLDALSRENIPGALIRLRGMSSHQVVTGDGQLWEIDNTGINLSQVLTAGATTALPPSEGEGGGSLGVTSTVTDGVWTLEGLPFGFYLAEEERAPEGYSLLPQHTAYGFWLLPPNVTIDANANVIQCPETGAVLHVDIDFEIIQQESINSVLISFENYPFGEIEVMKFDEVTGEPLAGAHFRIQGYFPEGNTNGMPIDRVGITGNDGRVVFDNLPAGQYTISEIEAPPGYQLDSTQFRSISLTWGQRASTSFYNKPKTFVEVIKVDGNDSSLYLDGARFRLTDPTSGETWEGVTVNGRVRLGEGAGSFGNQLVEGKLYILTEIQAPNGYVLDPTPREVIVAANNQLNTVTVRNFRKPSLTIRKFDELTNLPLAGASFRIWRTEGATWSDIQITGEDGVIVLTDLEPGIYSVQEIDEPFGYFRDPERREILLEGGDNKELQFFNRPRPVLTILKRDLVTGEPIEGVLFRVQQLEGGTIGEFLTDENGRIELSPRTGFLLEERIYRITELTPPVEYLLDANNVKDVMLRWHEPTEVVFENLLKPTLIFMKTNGLTGRGISGATFRVEFEDPNGGIVSLGSFQTRCGLIVIPHVQPGWYTLTETRPAPGFQLPSNPRTRVHLSPGENSYTFSQTQNNLFIDPRTNPNSGTRGHCGDWCGYLCSVLCAGNCGNPGGGNLAGNPGGLFGNLVITNGFGQPLGTIPSAPNNPPTTAPETEPDTDDGSDTDTDAEPGTPTEPPATGGGIIFLNPDFPGITITFGN